MGTISDLVNFQMLQPPTGSTLKPLAGLHVGGGVGAQDDTSTDPNSQFSTGGKGIGQAISKSQAPSATAQQQANWGTPPGDVDGPAGAEDFLPNAGVAAGDAVDSIGDLAAASDQQLKTNIKDADAKIDEFMNPLNVHSYQYKDKKWGEGTHFSVMAQELEKAGPVGKSMVIDTPEGKMVDYARGFAVNLAATAMHHQDIKDIQKTVEYLKKAVAKRKS